MQSFIRNSIRLKLSIATFFLFIIVNFLSCKKEPFPDYYVADSVRAYVSFKPGTYWIYKDDSTGNEDSIWVTSLKSTWKARLNSVDEVVGNDELITCKVNINDSNLIGEFNSLKTGVGYSLYDWKFGFNFRENSSTWNNTLSYQDSIFIDSIKYDHVLNFVVGFIPDYENYNHIDVHFKSNLGFLKWTIVYNSGHIRRQHLVRYYLAL